MSGWDQDDRPMPSGWWILPSFLLGAVSLVVLVGLLVRWAA